MRDPIKFSVKKGGGKKKKKSQAESSGGGATGPSRRTLQALEPGEKAEILSRVRIPVRAWAADSFQDAREMLVAEGAAAARPAPSSSASTLFFGHNYLRQCATSLPGGSFDRTGMDDRSPFGNRAASSDIDGAPGAIVVAPEAEEGDASLAVGAATENSKKPVAGSLAAGAAASKNAVTARGSAQAAGQQPGADRLLISEAERRVTLVVRIGMSLENSLRVTGVLVQLVLKDVDDSSSGQQDLGLVRLRRSHRDVRVTLFVYAVFLQQYPDVIRLWMRQGFDLQPRGFRPDPLLSFRSWQRVSNDIVATHRVWKSLASSNMKLPTPRFYLPDDAALPIVPEVWTLGWTVLDRPLHLAEIYHSQLSSSASSSPASLYGEARTTSTAMGSQTSTSFIDAVEGALAAHPSRQVLLLDADHGELAARAALDLIASPRVGELLVSLSRCAELAARSAIETSMWFFSLSLGALLVLLLVAGSFFLSDGGSRTAWGRAISQLSTSASGGGRVGSGLFVVSSRNAGGARKENKGGAGLVSLPNFWRDDFRYVSVRQAAPGAETYGAAL
eukprot:g172.t1